MKQDRSLIGDGGLKLRAKPFDQAVVVVCVLITLALLALGVLAIYTYVR